MVGMDGTPFLSSQELNTVSMVYLLSCWSKSAIFIYSFSFILIDDWKTANEDFPYAEKFPEFGVSKDTDDKLRAKRISKPRKPYRPADYEKKKSSEVQKNHTEQIIDQDNHTEQIVVQDNHIQQIGVQVNNAEQIRALKEKKRDEEHLKEQLRVAELLDNDLIRGNLYSFSQLQL